MFATLAGEYPREPRPGEDDLLGEADRRLAASEMDPVEHEAVRRAVVTTVVGELETSGLAVLTDGDVRHADRLAPLVAGLGGAATRRQVELPDGATVAAPRFDALPVWGSPISVAAWRWAAQATEQVVKQVVVGPYTISRAAVPGAVPRADLAIGLAEALNAELRALADAGCPLIQVDEGALTAIGADQAEWRLYAETQRRLTAGLDDTHLSLGLHRGGVDPTGHRPILDGPYRSFLFDGLGGPDAWRFAFAVPNELGVIVGALDAASTERDESEVLVWALAWAADRGRTPERIGIASNGSLRAIGRHAARRKIELMGEAVGIAAMGPIGEVAEALDPDPLESRMAPLRSMAEAVDAGRTAR